ncbi:MAG: SpoIIE family protein phosphatase, partial [Crocinitomicaceae bacterium]|nr:SpoIIE family protein phosphatase [Crocinitomicaceae bacterium]
MHKILITILCLNLGLSVCAQNSPTDSLENLFYQKKNINDKAEILKEIFDEVEYSDPHKSLIVAKQLLDLSPATDDKMENRLYALNLIGIAYMNLNMTDSSFAYFNQLNEISTNENRNDYKIKALNNLAALSFNSGNVDGAMEYMFSIKEMNEDSGNLVDAAGDCVNLAAIYEALGSIDSARIFMQKGIELYGEAQDSILLARAYMNFAAIELNAENFNKSVELSLLAIQTGLACGNITDVARAYLTLGNNYYKLGKFQLAIDAFKSGLEYAKQSDNLEAISIASKGVAYSSEKLGNYKDAFEYQKYYGEIQDSITDLRNMEQYIDMQEKYKAEETKKANEILIQKNKIQDLEIEKNAEEIQNSRIVIISSILGLVLLIVLAITLYNRNVIKQRANLKLQEANAIINEKNADILASIEYASKIQEALLPTKDNPDLFKDSFFMLKPKDIVSGDFLWYSEVEGKKIFAVVDCTGHGVPGAFMSMIGNTFLQQIVNERQITRPAEILNELRQSVIRALNQKGLGTNRKDGMDMALCVVDDKSKKLEFAGANNPMFLIQAGVLIEVRGDKQPVGYFEGFEDPFTNHEFNIESGDCIYITSDGYVDQFGGPKGKKFKYKQFKELLFSISLKSMQDQKKILAQTFEDWKGSLEQ